MIWSSGAKAILCVLFPHVKDSMWVAAAYGAVEEAERLGVKLTLLQAGGYENLPKQISQFDDFVAAKSDAIITGAISEAGMAKKFAGQENPADHADQSGRGRCSHCKSIGRPPGSR